MRFFPGRFLAECDSNAVLAFLSFVFNLFCDLLKEKATKILYVGTRLWPICFLFFTKCAWKNTMRASTYNMEIKIT